MAVKGLREAAADFAEGLGSFFGVTVTYSRGAGSVSLKALRGEDNLMMVGDEAQSPIPVTEWSIVASELVIAEETILPQPGDTIAYGGQTWVVVGGQPYRTEAFGAYLKINTVERE